jgi:hypothetical protein
MFFFDGVSALIGEMKKNNKTFTISHNNNSGEFRYEINPTQESLQWIKENYNSIINAINYFPYFYSQKDALKYCETNNLKLDE